MANYNITNQNSEQISKWINEGWSAYKISKTLGCAKSSVLSFLKKRGIKSQHECKVDYNDMLKDKAGQVIEMYLIGMSVEDIGEELGHAGSQVWHLLQKYNIDTTRKVYSVDESFFAKIDTEEKAYTLGFIFADGNVMPSGLIRISIADQDVDILEKIKVAIKFGGEIHDKLRDESRMDQKELYICRKSMVADLAKLGCIPNKSLVLQFPTPEQVMPELLCHFVRGYFDGDGSISEHRANITSSYDFIQGLIKVLPCGYTSTSQRYKEKGLRESAHSLNMSRREDYSTFLHWIYKDAKIYLDRKYKKYLEYFG